MKKTWDTDLALMFDRFMRSIHFGLQQKAGDFDRKSVGPGGGMLLMTLADAGQVSQNELSRRMVRDKSQMTRMIQGLEGKGLVRRENSTSDGRVVMVSLTAEGEQVVEELLEAVADVIGDLLAPISANETQLLKQLLSRIV